MKIVKCVEVFVFGFSLNFIIFSEASKDLPGFVPKCLIDDPKLDHCILKATETLRPYLRGGVPEMGFPPLNPLILPEILLEQGTPTLNYKAKLTNISIYGLDNYKFEYMRIDLKRLQDKVISLLCKVKFEKLYLKSLYEVTGRVLVAPIQGNGTVYVNVTSVSCEVKQNFNIERRNGGHGRRYLNMTEDSYLKLDISDSIPKYEGLFNGNERIAELTNQVIMDNSKELILEMTPEIEIVVKKLVREIGGNVFQTIPFSKLLPKTIKPSSTVINDD